MIGHGENILAANIATGVFIAITLLAFWPWGEDEQDKNSSKTESEKKEKEVQK